MLPASNRAAGQNIGFPDVCNTIVGPATAPLPYPNIGMNAQAAPFSPNVKVSMVNALNVGSMIPMTSGDEAGTAHPTIKGPSRYTMGNPVVFVNMMQGISLTNPTTGNNMNNAAGAVLVPSAVNVLYGYRAPDAGDSGPAAGLAPSLSAEAMEALQASLDAPALHAELLPGGVGWIRVALFTAELGAGVFTAIRDLDERGMGVLILDLRGCPGGELSAALRLAGDFLPQGAVIARVTDGDGDTVVHSAPEGEPHVVPLVVLVDRATASSAELFAGCLKAHRRALLVGETTYGKGVAQAMVPDPSGSGVLYATAAICAPADEGEIQGVGVRPDLEVVREGPVPAELEDDVQLRAGLRLALAMLEMM